MEKRGEFCVAFDSNYSEERLHALDMKEGEGGAGGMVVGCRT